MEQGIALAERIKALKAIATTIHEGALHTQLVPEVSRVLALPENVVSATVVQREAILREVRELEQCFDRLGYTLLDQIMPSTNVSAIFRVTQAADEFKSWLKQHLGQVYQIGDEKLTIDRHLCETLTKYSLSIGTPPVTDDLSELVARIIFGRPVEDLLKFVEIIPDDHHGLSRLFNHFQELIESSLHYCTAAEERGFLRDAAQFSNFEGATLFNRVVVTESPSRVIHLITDHVFDKFGLHEKTAVKLVDGIDRLDNALLRTMQAEPNQVFLARVTGVPHHLLAQNSADGGWGSVIGRLILIDVSRRAQLSNTTLVYTLFPHVARTLRNVQIGFAGLPANTQLNLRRILEQYPREKFAEIRNSIEQRMKFHQAEGALDGSIDEVRTQEWRRHSLMDYLTLGKLKRAVVFFEQLSSDHQQSRQRQAAALSQKIIADWMEYFYPGLTGENYPAVLVSGGGRGALSRIGDFHRHQVRKEVERFLHGRLESCEQRLNELKNDLKIPSSSSDEIEAAIQQSQLRSSAPSQWQAQTDGNRSFAHLARSLWYQAAGAARRITTATEEQLDRAAFGSLTGPATVALKKAMARAGWSALHGHLQDRVGAQINKIDRSIRNWTVPFQEVIRSAKQRMDTALSENDSTAVGEIEAALLVIKRGGFLPTLILPEMAWAYGDVFPEKHYPRSSVLHVPLNDHYEMDPKILLRRIEELRYLFRGFPEIFELFCRSMLLVINSPHNPTGVAYRRETILKLLQIAAEYDLTVVDDNAYHLMITSQHAELQGRDCVAQTYEKFKTHLHRPVRIITAGATTKGLLGAGDRTGIVHANVPEAIDFISESISEPHLMSLYMTGLKLETGLAAKRCAAALKRLSARLISARASPEPWNELRALLYCELERARTDDIPMVVFETLLDGYESMLRLQQRSASVKELCEHIGSIIGRLDQLRLENRLRKDMEKRFAQFDSARRQALPKHAFIKPSGAFYACIRLCSADNDHGVQPFLESIARFRKVDVTYAGRGFVRVSLGGALPSDSKGYDLLGVAAKTYLGLLNIYWEKFEATGRNVTMLEQIFNKPDGISKTDKTADSVSLALADLLPLIKAHPPRKKVLGQPVGLAEREVVYCIEEGRSVADKIFVDFNSCESAEELLRSRVFRIIYRRLLKRVYRQHPELGELPFEQIDNQYGPLALLAAYRDRQLIDGVFRQLVQMLYQAWHGPNTVKVLAAHLDAGRHSEKIAALHGIHRRINDLINELTCVFAAPPVEAKTTFEIGYEILTGIEPNASLPQYLQRIIRGSIFAGATVPLNPAPNFVTGAVKRVSDFRYGFTRRDGANHDQTKPPFAYFQSRLENFAATANLEHYVCKAEQVGPFRMLVMIHKACFHLVNDQLRLFPQLETVQRRENINQTAWDGVMLFGIPSRFMGESYKTGYVLDRKADGVILPTAWVAREDATDYVGFLKKTLLTLHNEQVKAMGGMPVHGAMITITFKNGLRKTLVFAGDSGTGKSETITAMMEQQIEAEAAEVKKVDILAGDMLSLWRGDDGQVYAFGTETGDFLRLTDITESWKGRFGDLLRRGSFSNLDYAKNPRVTIPGICDARKLLAPTRVNGFFYINNYASAGASAVELDDAHHVLKQVLVRGLRKNKGTSGDQPSLRAGLEHGGVSELVARHRHLWDKLLDWSEREEQGRTVTYLVFRDGSGDAYAARELVEQAFIGRQFQWEGRAWTVRRVRYDVLENIFWISGQDGAKVALQREVYDQIFEPLVGTFCGNPFVDPEGMDQILERFAQTMRAARVHVGVIATQLARPGFEHLGPAQAARDVVRFLLGDDEVNARFQRNKDKVHQAMRRTFAGVLEAGSNLPVELEGYNLLLLEAHESTHVVFHDLADREFSLSTPLYNYCSSRDEAPRSFIPAIATPEHLEAIADVCANAEQDVDLSDFKANLAQYGTIGYWSSREELIYQVLLVNGVINIGSSVAEVTRFPAEVRKASHIANLIIKQRAPQAV